MRLPLGKYFFVILAILMLFRQSGKATHLMGGTTSYTCIGKSTYAIEFVIYRDCSGSNIPIPTNLVYYLQERGSSKTTSRSVFRFSIAKVISNRQKCSGAYCAEKGIFRDTLKLGPSATGFDIYYTTTARNNAVLNIYANAGMVWSTFIPPDKYKNSSPSLVKDLVPILCDNKLNIFNPGFSDPDKDSLSFSLVQPYSSVTTTSSGPSFTNVTYNSGYSASAPLGSNGALSINAANGEITAFPKSIGNYVFAIEVKEYRYDKSAGKYIQMGTTRVDVQFIVLSCQVKPPPKFDSVKTKSVYLYVGDAVCFDVTGRDSNYNGHYDLLHLTASSGIFAPGNGVSAPYAKFSTSGGYKTIAGTVCWTPGFQHITTSSPYLVTFHLEDTSCNSQDVTYSIFVRPALLKPPVLMCADAQKKNSIRLTWKQSGLDSAFRKYNIYRNTGNFGGYSLLSSINNFLTTSYQDTTIKNADAFSYSYFITITDTAGREGRTSDTLRSIVLASKNISTGQTRFNWNPLNYFWKDTFKVYIDSGTGWRHYTNTIANSYIFPFCLPNLKVRILETHGKYNCYSGTCNNNIYSLRDTIPPAKPGLFKLNVIEQGKVEISIDTSASSDVKEYSIYRSSSANGLFSKIITLSQSAATYFLDKGLRTDTISYYYCIKATDYCGNTAISPMHNTILLKAKAKGLSVTLNWTFYKGFPITRYRIERWESNLWTPVTTVTNTTGSYTDLNVTCRGYAYRIRGEEVNGSKRVTYSDSVFVMPYDTLAPATPPVPLVTVLGNNDVKLNFVSVAAKDVTGYIITVVYNDTVTEVLDTVRISYPKGINYIHKSAHANVNHLKYIIQALDSCGNLSLPSIHSPVALSAKGGNLKASLKWYSYTSRPVNKYYIERNDGTAWKTIDSAAASDTSYSDTNALKCTRFFSYRIRTILGISNLVSYSDTSRVQVTDTAKPLPPVIQTVQYLNDSILEIVWTKSPSKGVKYNEFLLSSSVSGWIVLDTFGKTGNASSKITGGVQTPDCYSLRAIDSCSLNASTLASAHCPVYLNTSTQGCKKEIILKWTAYSGWNGVSNYLIYRSENSGKESILANVTGSVLSFSDTAVTNYSTYCYRVQAISATGLTSFSNRSCKNVFQPAMPVISSVSKTVTGKLNGNVRIKWQVPGSLQHLKSYALYYKSSLSGNFILLNANIPLSQDSFILQGLNTKYDDYCFYIETIDSCGGKSLASAPHSTINLEGTIGQLVTKLYWTPYKGWKPTAYFIERWDKGRFTKIDSAPGTDTFSRLFPAPCNRKMYYRIKAVDGSGNFSLSDSIGSQTIDSIPANSATLLNASVSNGNTNKILFQTSDSPDVYMHVIMRGTNGNWLTAGQSPMITKHAKVSFDDKVNTLTDNHSYTVLTLDSCLNVSYSDTFRTIQLKGKPLNQAVQLNWSAFKGYAISNYRILKMESLNKWSQLAILKPSDSSFIDSPLHCGKDYFYKVEAIQNSGGLNSYSDSIKLTPFDTISPPAPVLRSVFPLSGSSVRISWTYSTGLDVKYFDIFRNRNGGSFKKIQRIGFDTSFIDKGIATKTDSLRYYVVAVDSCNFHTSVPSDTGSLLKLSLVNGACLPSIKILWQQKINTRKDIDSLILFRSIDNGISWNRLVSVSPLTTSYIDPNLSQGSRYSYKMKAISLSRPYSAWSDSFSDTPFVFPKPAAAILYSAGVTYSNSLKGEITLKWQKVSGSDPYVMAYRLYHSDPLSGKISYLTEIKDLNITSFIHRGVNSISQPHAYFIKLVNICGKEGPSSQVHKVMQLYIDHKNLVEKLKWTPYQGFPIASYKIYRSENGKSPTVLTSLKNTDTSFTDTTVHCNRIYSYQVLAIEDKGYKAVSQSDSISVTAFDTFPAPIGDVSSLKVLNSDKTKGVIKLQWIGNQKNTRSGFAIYRAVNSGMPLYLGFAGITTYPKAEWMDKGLNTEENTYSYYLRSTDSCSAALSLPSDTHKTVHLSLSVRNKEMLLEWTRGEGMQNPAYILQRQELSGIWKDVARAKGDGKFTDKNVICHHYYGYRIVVNQGIDSSISNVQGDTAINTDLPLVTTIKRVSVESSSVTNGKIRLEWNPSVTLNTAGYLVYRSVNGIQWKTVALVKARNYFTDSAISTLDYAYYYKIQTVDSCGNLSLESSEPHRTILLHARPGNEKIRIRWQPYMGWKVKSYALYRNGNLVARLPAFAVSYIDSQVLCVQSYRYELKAIADSSLSLVSVSNLSEARPYDSIAPMPAIMQMVSILDPNKTAELKWSPSPSWDVLYYEISREKRPFGNKEVIYKSNNRSDSEYTDHFMDSDPAFCYTISAHDYCGNVSKISNSGCLIVLDGKTKPQANSLTWNPYIEWKSGVLEYEVYRNEDGKGWTRIGNTSTLKFSDDELSDTGHSFCYQVKALPMNNKSDAYSNSTVICLHQEAIVFMPNAFTPELSKGLNDLFGPVGAFIKTYDMQIFDRWGELVYHTSEGKAWDGKCHGQFAAEGMYIYILNVTGDDGKMKMLKGSLNLLK